MRYDEVESIDIPPGVVSAMAVPLIYVRILIPFQVTWIFVQIPFVNVISDPLYEVALPTNPPDIEVLNPLLLYKYPINTLELADASPYNCARIHAALGVVEPVFLYQTDAVQLFPKATFGKVQDVEPFKIMPFPPVFLE
jgi:hypothetical protein